MEDSFHAEDEPRAGSRFSLSCRTVNIHCAIAAATSVTEEFEVLIMGIGGSYAVVALSSSQRANRLCSSINASFDG